tara:strand:- start:548 stop:766 length:219 start_codon:yes stop_codon:yes gene_type:complete
MDDATQLDMEDKVIFDDGSTPPTHKTYFVKDIVTRSFNNAIWRSGFAYGFMSGGAIILLIVAFIVLNLKVFV